jgi:hypothetical protein
MLKVLILIATLSPCILVAQDSTKKRLPLCNPVILGSIPKKALSLQYEYQSKFENDSKNNTGFPINNTNIITNSVSNFRIGFNKNVRAKPNGYISVDFGYANTSFNGVSNNGPNPNPMPAIFNDDFFHAINASTTIFKPLDDKQFLLANIGLELNGNTASLKNLGAKNLFASALLMYGKKKSYNEMWAFGISRSYRLGRVIHVPAILWTKNFNKKWGMEMLLPSKLIFRYAPNKKTIYNAGVELEGNQYAISNNLMAINNSFFQRGEIRPKLGLETNLTKNMRFIANAGVRINGRFDIADNYDGKRLLVENSPKPNAFVNVGIGWVSLKAKKK